jgi:lipoprotein-anchoring transpeptidase ErfK/SrfK
MTDVSRRAVAMGGCATLVAAGLAGCVSTNSPVRIAGAPIVPLLREPRFMPAPENVPKNVYGPIEGEPFPIAAVDLSGINPAFLRTEVAYAGTEPPGTIVIDPGHHYLYEVLDAGRATRFGIGVGREGFGWSGTATIKSKQAWPDWYPPKEMIRRQPGIRAELAGLQGGLGMPGGPRNPLGARAMYLWQDNRDTLYRIHGTFEPRTIGTNVSSGCIRMINQDVIDLYSRVPLGAKVLVLT